MFKGRKRIFIGITRRGLFKLIAAGGGAAVLIAVIAVQYASTRTSTPLILPLSGMTIAVDAGHGGVDGGAESRDGRIVEKEITLKLALQLRDYLQQAGALVVMTREDDRDLASPGTKGFSRRKTEDLLSRAALIKNADPDLMITIHLNSMPSSRWRGAQTFYYPDREESRRLAVMIQDEIRSSIGNTNRVANTAPTIYLLKALPMPSALVEVGFLSNPEEAALLADESYQRKMAAAIYRGILRYASSDESIGTP